MCYKSTLTKPLKSLVAYKKTPAKVPGKYTPSYNIDGFAHPGLLIIPQEDTKMLYPATWGLVPDFQLRDPEGFFKEGKYNTLNARDDKVFASNTYKKPILEGRCLVFADGFYEPHEYLKKKQPYFCYISGGEALEDRQLFTFAGIYTATGDGAFYVSLITVPANPFFAEVHNAKLRMPLVLDRRVEDAWIEEGQSPNIIKEIMNDGFTSKPFEAHPVSNLIYSKTRTSETDSQEILKPVASIEPPSLF